MNIIVGNEHGDPCPILDEAVYISHSANTLGKVMNATILPSALDKILGQTGLFNHGIATSPGEGKL